MSFRYVTNLLKNGAYSETTEKRLYGATAEIATSIGLWVTIVSRDAESLRERKPHRRRRVASRVDLRTEVVTAISYLNDFARRSRRTKVAFKEAGGAARAHFYAVAAGTAREVEDISGAKPTV